MDDKIRLYKIRNQDVILDCALAIIYDMPTKRVNEISGRNEHFFKDKIFRLSMEERKLVTNGISLRGGHRPWAYTQEAALELINYQNINKTKIHKETGYEEEIIEELKLQDWTLQNRQLNLFRVVPDLVFTKENEVLIVEVQVGELDRYHLYKTLEYRDLYFIEYGIKPLVKVFCEIIPEHYQHIASIHNINIIAKKFKGIHQSSVNTKDADKIKKELINLFAK